MDSGILPESRFKVDSLENTINEIQRETTAQHTLLKELKDHHLKLKEELQEKNEGLQNSKDKKMHVIEELKLEEFRAQETEEKYQIELELTNEVRREIKLVQEHLQKEKDKQLESLKAYEEKMAVLANRFREGPQYYNRKSMTQKIKNLENISAGLKKEIEENQKRIDESTKVFMSMAKESTAFNDSASSLLKQLDNEVENFNKMEIPILKAALKTMNKLVGDQKSNTFLSVSSEE